MKKIVSAVLSFTLMLLLFLPESLSASASTADAVIDMHGDKTYLGTSANWSKRWNADNFDDYTGKDVSYGGSITVKSGKVGNISVSGDSSKLIVQGGTMDDIYSDGKMDIKKGDVKSAEARSDITVSGGSIRHDVISDEGDVTLNNTVSIGGSVKGKNISLNSGAIIKVTGTITGTKQIYLNKCSLTTRGFSGDNTGSLEVKSYDTYLPPIENIEGIVADANNKVMVNDKITAESLYIKDKAQFITTSSLELDTLQGPGILCFNAGKLTIHCDVSDNPLLVFNNAVSSGTVAFKADEGAVSEDEVELYDYGLEKDTSGGYDEFKLKKVVANGLLLDKSKLSVSSKSSGTVRATTKPVLSKFADGTKIKWELYGDTSAFSISPNTSDNSCSVSLSSSTTGTHKATLTAYLVDAKGDRLSDYKSDSCIVQTGYADDTDDTDLKLDTGTVSILSGNKYCVLATTNSTSMPHAMSYNSSVATVGAGKAVKDKNGNSGWLYPVTGISKGKVTIDIDGQKMITNVSAGILMDTASYTMSPGGKYCIGVQIKGLDESKLDVYSVNSCTDVQLIKKGNDGKNIYRVTAMQTGIGYVVFSITGGQMVTAEINVQNGAAAGGKSARMVALA